MTPKPWVLSPDYVEFAKSVRELHRFVLEGREESPEADAVREASDRPWYALTEIEKARAAGLSGDLDALVEPEAEVEPMNPQAQSKLNEFYEARERGDWDRALALLRRWAKYVAPPLLAYLWGTVWRGAGDRESAALFFEQAHRLEPGAPQFFVEWLSAADPLEVRADVEHVLARPEDQSLVVLVFAVSKAIGSYPDPGPPLADHQRYAEILKSALDRPSDGEPSDVSLVRSLGYLRLAEYHRAAGDTRAAFDACTNALAIIPNDTRVLTVRGLLEYGSNPQAIDDLERAASLGANFVWPYFALAHERFREGRFRECLDLCGVAQRFDAPAVTKGLLAEWTAIARAEMEFPPALVREAFEEAVRLDPSNASARRNREFYEGWLVSSPKGPRQFETLAPCELRDLIPVSALFMTAA